MSTRPDFATLDTHVLRVGHNTLLDIPLEPAHNAQVWVATIWPDPNHTSGWGRLVWQPNPIGRGWTIEPLTHIGDVIEFGADTPTNQDRWYGYCANADDTGLVLVGPYTDPGDALDDGWASLARWREARRESGSDLFSHAEGPRARDSSDHSSDEHHRER